MPSTPADAQRPGLAAPSDLRGVEEEKTKITRIVNDRMVVEHLNLPSVDDVVDKLRTCSVAHFACHGSTDRTDPSNSGLLLQKQAEGGAADQDRLTVRRISELSLASARIAYLSACSTAENEAAWLTDEVIHVVSGFQVAGFPHVVGCLWPSLDYICVDVASEFYRLLLLQRGNGGQGKEVAATVQKAVLSVREENRELPLYWAQFVHYGA
jgi:CHAT domain-containing protein